MLRPVVPSRRSPAAEVGAYARGWRDRVRRGASQIAATVAIALALAALVILVTGSVGTSALRPLDDNRGERFVSRYQIERLRSALEVYRVETGAYPESLDALVEAGLARPRDLRYPWAQEYAYRRLGEGYRLLPPVE